MLNEPTKPDPPGKLQFTGPRAMAVIFAGTLMMFWLGYGELSGFAISFALFLVLIAAAVEYLPKLSEQAEAVRAGEGRSRGPGPLDGLAVIWLLSIPFAPALTWMFQSMIDVDDSNWSSVLGFTAFACVVVPLVCVVPMLGYVRRSNARLALTILALGTAYPVLNGAGAAYDMVKGPVWQSVDIVRLVDLSFMTGTGTIISADGAKVDLADGRRLSRSSKVPLQTGPARVLVLRGTRRIIAVVR